MKPPTIGRLCGVVPERVTLVEVRKIAAGADIRHRANEAKASIKSMDNVEVKNA